MSIFMSGHSLSHLLAVDREGSTFVLILSSFQRSYCTLPTLLVSMREAFLFPVSKVYLLESAFTHPFYCSTIIKELQRNEDKHKTANVRWKALCKDCISLKFAQRQLIKFFTFIFYIYFKLLISLGSTVLYYMFHGIPNVFCELKG